MNKVLVVYGTRPEAIKMVPLVDALKRSTDLTPIVAVTGQHREMLDQVNTLFGVVPDFDLNIITPRQSLEAITARALQGVGEIISTADPDAVLVQGDTTTCFAAALGSFYRQVPVVHLEAGLRTWDRTNPFPEEINRVLTTQLASLHLAPTATSRGNLVRSGIEDDAIVVTGNTVIDALLEVVARDIAVADPLLRRTLADSADRPLLLVTSHRRESWGAPMHRVAVAVGELARRFPDLLVLLPAHLNPVVREVLLPPLAGLGNVVITEPLSYSDFSRALARSTVILTDSGGVQEEAPSLGKPVLVLRDTTERPEAVDAGTVRLVGTDSERIVAATSTLLTDPDSYRSMAHAVNPYGDGQAAIRSVAAIRHYLGLAGRPADFSPGITAAADGLQV